MQSSGTSGRSARHYGDELALLRGILTDGSGAVYPEDRCPECEKEGKLIADEKCFHRHWKEREKSEQ